MAGEGFVMDMIRRSRQNRALRKQKINRYKEMARSLRYNTKVELRETRKFKEYTDAEMAAMKEEVKREVNMRYYGPWIISTVITILIFLVLFIYLNQYHS